MSELKLTVTERFQPENVAAIRAGLSKHLRVSEPVTIYLRSDDPPSFLRLLGDFAAWLPLAAPATVYLSTLAKHAADATWNKLAAVFKNNDAKPVVDVANTLANAVEKVGRDVSIFIGINIPDDRFGTAIPINSDDPKKIAYLLASFAVRAEEISKAMQAEVEAGRGPFGNATIELQEDGSLLIRWVSQADYKVRELRIPRTK